MRRSAVKSFSGFFLHHSGLWSVLPYTNHHFLFFRIFELGNERCLTSVLIPGAYRYFFVEWDEVFGFHVRAKPYHLLENQEGGGQGGGDGGAAPLLPLEPISDTGQSAVLSSEDSVGSTLWMWEPLEELSASSFTEPASGLHSDSRTRSGPSASRPPHTGPSTDERCPPPPAGAADGRGCVPH